MTQKINILFVVIQLGMGGTERLIYNLCLKLDKGLFNSSIVYFNRDEVAKEFYSLGISLFYIPKNKRFDLSTMRKLGKLIKDNNIHIVNAHHFMPMIYSIYGCSIINHRKLICTLHSGWEIEQISWKWKTISHYLMRRVDGIIGVSTDISNIARDEFKIDPSKVFTIPNGTDCEVFVDNNRRADLRKEIGLLTSEKTIGMVANFKKVKNHLFLIRAFQQLIKEYSNVKLLLIGQGFQEDPESTELEMRRYIIQNTLTNDVLFLGYRSDIPALLSILDIFCLTSLNEGLPMSVIEAMAAGLPIIGTDVEGIRDIIIPHRNGLLVKPDDVDGLKNALLSLLENESMRFKMGQESRNLAATKYSLTRTISEYQDLFLSMINN